MRRCRYDDGATRGLESRRPRGTRTAASRRTDPSLAAAAQAGRGVEDEEGRQRHPARCDVLLVPGAGGGLAAALANPALLGQLARLGAEAGVVASACTGSLLLGAAGLLRGRRATSHWTSRPCLRRSATAVIFQ